MGNTLHQGDTNLVSGFKKNDQKVMQEVYQITFPKFRSHVLKNSGNDAQAKDVFQEAFIACWRNIKENKLAESSNVEAYLFTIAKHKWIDFLRSSNFRKTVHAEHLSSLAMVPNDNEADETEKESRRKILQRALQQLGANCKNMLQLFYFERKSMDVISAELNIAPTSARNQKYRCMEKLRALSLELKDNG